MKHIATISATRPASAASTLPINSVFWQWVVWLIDAYTYGYNIADQKR